MRVPTPHRGSVGFNMTPMIDVVFLLIIFFILASHFQRQETQLQLALPAAETGEAPEGYDARRLLINVLPDGQILLGSVATRTEELQPLIEHASRQAGGTLQVRIRGDRTVDYGFIEPVLLACAKAGVWNVSFAVVSRRPDDAKK